MAHMACVCALARASVCVRLCVLECVLLVYMQVHKISSLRHWPYHFLYHSLSRTLICTHTHICVCAPLLTCRPVRREEAGHRQHRGRLNHSFPECLLCVCLRVRELGVGQGDEFKECIVVISVSPCTHCIGSCSSGAARGVMSFDASALLFAVCQCVCV